MRDDQFPHRLDKKDTRARRVVFQDASFAYSEILDERLLKAIKLRIYLRIETIYAWDTIYVFHFSISETKDRMYSDEMLLILGGLNSAFNHDSRK
jgi:hypothetical protein